jgi:hypothetical protein
MEEELKKNEKKAYPIFFLKNYYWRRPTKKMEDDLKKIEDDLKKWKIT